MTLAVERVSAAADVHTRLARHLLVDGFDLVLDLERSHGSWLVDARDGTEYLDLFTFFASSALGMNHPGLAHDPAFRAELLAAALTKPSNSDVYTVEMARFVDTFDRVLGDPACRTCSSSRAARSPSRTRSRSRSTGSRDGTRRTASTPPSAPACCTCARRSTAGPGTRCR